MQRLQTQRQKQNQWANTNRVQPAPTSRLGQLDLQPVTQEAESLQTDQILGLETLNGNRALPNVGAQGKDAPSPIIQPKLTVGRANDKYEREADAVANQIVNVRRTQGTAATNASSVGRSGVPEGQRTVRAKALTKTIRRMTSSASGTVDTQVESAIQNTRGKGRSLDGSLRESMENAFGVDFSQITIHTDAQSDMLNRSLNARAFTTGQDVYFRSGEYRSGTVDGQRLIAHELTHAVQQGGSTAGLINRWPFGKGGKSEEETPLLDGQEHSDDFEEISEVDDESVSTMARLRAFGDKLAQYHAIHNNYKKYASYIGDKAWNLFLKAWDKVNTVLGWIAKVDPSGITEIISSVSSAVRTIVQYITEAVRLSDSSLVEELTPLLPPSISLSTVADSIKEAMDFTKTIKSAVESLASI